MEQPTGPNEKSQAALVVLKTTRKRAKKRKKETKKRKPYKPRTKPADSSSSNTIISHDFTVKPYGTAEKKTETSEEKKGTATVDEIIGFYEGRLDPDTKTESDKTKDEIPKIDDYTGENIEDSDKNTSDRIPPKPSEPKPGEAKVQEGWSGEEIVRLLDGAMALVNPILVRMITRGEKRIPRGEHKMTSDDKKLLIKPANEIAEELQENVSPWTKLITAFTMIELGVLSEYIDQDDIKNLFKKKPKTEDQTQKPL